MSAAQVCFAHVESEHAAHIVVSDVVASLLATAISSMRMITTAISIMRMIAMRPLRHDQALIDSYSAQRFIVSQRET